MVTNMQVAKRLTLWAEPVELPTSDVANVVVGGGEDQRGTGEYALLAIELPGVTASAHLDAGQVASLIEALRDVHNALTPESGDPR